MLASSGRPGSKSGGQKVGVANVMGSTSGLSLGGSANGPAREKRKFREAIMGGLRGRCPHCARGLVFRSWFKVLDECPVCHLSYRPESGYYTGAMYLNYVLALILITPAFIASVLLYSRTASLEPWELAVIWGGAGVLISLGLMHFSYGVWLAVDYWLNP